MDVLMTKKSALSLIRAFLKDTRGNYALMTVIAAVPLFGAVALAVDYSEMSRERQMTLNALDASGIATARRILEGAPDAEVEKYARQFFDANLGGIDPKRATLNVVLPKNNVGGGTLKMSADLSYDPIFFGTFQSMLGKDRSALSFAAATEIKLKNTIEVALVLDNSGSMDESGSGSGRPRIDILKDAAKQLVETMASQSGQMKQVDKPVQIGLVPFAASVNVGPASASENWMDVDGISPVHHENFDWSSFGDRSTSPNLYVEDVGGEKRARGRNWTIWDIPEGSRLTRFTLYKKMQAERRGRCLDRRWWGCARYDASTYSTPLTWEGCVETRPYPYNINDEAPSKSKPATMFVPMFAPDEASGGSNDWWPDGAGNNDAQKQANMRKYFEPSPDGWPTPGAHAGPNFSCTTTSVLPLTDVSASSGVTTVNSAIDNMKADGNTNVPEGMAWGWRVLSSKAPFVGGRPETERGNDKVLIVLTDGANTYSAIPTSRDGAGNKSTYAAYGYAGKNLKGTNTPRIFENTNVSRTNYSGSNFTNAMNQHFAKLCDNAKAENIIVMTVALDLKSGTNRDPGNQAQIDALTACASDSRVRKGPDGKAAKLFWNSTGASLAEDFRSIADELSNLRIVS
jgi:Flp pilus assembly protein TadG